ncbi:MAG: hypothetical protein SGARI_000441, partial [Bacillariaceae sp.]
HVASTISRQGWAVSTARTTASGAVNLVGHKQPVVVARHCPYLINVREEGGDSADDQPEYATLLALGDKKGFVTVWTTRKSRPVFKIQCSESRSTVTDLAWGRLDNEKGDLMLIVSLLDGQVVALRFGIPDELGHLLDAAEQARVFEIRYGIDASDANGGLMGGRKLFVGVNSGPKFIENPLQLALEKYQKEKEESKAEESGENNEDEGESSDGAGRNDFSSEQIRANQLVSRTKGGKKRVQPLLMQTTALPPSKKQKLPNGTKTPEKSKPDTLETAVEAAEKAAKDAEALTVQRTNGNAPSTAGGTPQVQHQEQPSATRQAQNMQLLAGAQASPQIPHSKLKIHTVQLEVTKTGLEDQTKFFADCVNSIQVPQGSSGSALPCAVLNLSKDGQRMWNDQLPGTSCCAIAASKSWLVVGTADGCVHVYGTSPTLGWASMSAFRSHPPFVFGRPIIALHLKQSSPSTASTTQADARTELLVVTSDGKFSVYDLEPSLKLQYKGSIKPAMTHMLLAADLETDLYLPQLSRIQLTETGRLLLLLSLQQVTETEASGRRGRGGHGSDRAPSLGAGGSIQGFVYDRLSELWIRVSDSRFLLSDFYSTLPSTALSMRSKSAPPAGELTKMDDAVRMGAIASTLQKSRRGRLNDAATIYAATSERNIDPSDVASRSHCEDRMACCLALGSAAEFEYWFSMYIRTLAMTGDETLLRMTVDMLMGQQTSGGTGAVANANSNGDAGNNNTAACWWLSDSPSVLKFDRIKLIRTVVIPEMSKNRALQRVTNEISIEVNMLTPEQ